MNQFIQPSQCLNSVPQANAKADDDEIKGSPKKKKKRKRGRNYINHYQKTSVFKWGVFDLHCLWCKRKALPSIWQPDLHFVGIRGQHRGLGEGRMGREQEKDSSNKCQGAYFINTTCRPWATSPLSVFLLDLWEDRSIKSWRFSLVCRYMGGVSSNTKGRFKMKVLQTWALRNCHFTHREVLLLFIISVAWTVSERTTSSGSLLHDSSRDRAETWLCHQQTKNRIDQVSKSCSQVFKIKLNGLKRKKEKKGIVFYPRIESELILQQVKDILTRREHYSAETSGLCTNCLFHLHSPWLWHFSWQCFRPLLPKMTAIGFLIWQSKEAQKCLKIFR